MLNAEIKERLCAAQWDILTQPERYSLLNGCLGVGADFYRSSKLQWSGLTLELRAELVMLDWEAMLGRQLKIFRENPNY